MVFPYTPPTVTRFPVKGIVTLCGSNRFSKTFDYIAQELNVNMWIALRPSFYNDAQLYHNKPEIKKRLDIIHMSKIEIGELIIVINTDALNIIPYIGESTRNEISYAREIGRKVVWLSCTKEMLDNGIFQLEDMTYKEFNERYNIK